MMPQGTWMWGDASLVGHHLATLNPLRYSQKLDVPGLIADLEGYASDRRHCNRPVKLTLYDSTTETSLFQNVQLAIAYLKHYDPTYDCTEDLQQARDLHQYLLKDSVAEVRALLENADSQRQLVKLLWYPDKFGQSAIHQAVSWGRHRVLQQFFESWEASINTPMLMEAFTMVDTQNRTLEQLAGEQGNDGDAAHVRQTVSEFRLRAEQEKKNMKELQRAAQATHDPGDRLLEKIPSCTSRMRVMTMLFEGKSVLHSLAEWDHGRATREWLATCSGVKESRRLLALQNSDGKTATQVARKATGSHSALREVGAKVCPSWGDDLLQQDNALSLDEYLSDSELNGDVSPLFETNPLGQTALHWAAYNSRHDVVCKLLVRAEFKRDTKRLLLWEDEEGETALIVAAQGQGDEASKVLNELIGKLLHMVDHGDLAEHELDSKVLDPLLRGKSWQDKRTRHLLERISQMRPTLLSTFVNRLIPWLEEAKGRAVNHTILRVLESQTCQALEKCADMEVEFGNHPLHIAAREGFGKLCQKLVEAGAIPRRYNKEGKTPAEIGMQHNEVKDYFDRFNDVTMMRCGNGEAWPEFQQDHRHVVEVAWYLVTMSHTLAGRLGGKHSILAVTVHGGMNGIDSTHMYSIEKTAKEHQTGEGEQFENGIHVSHWKDVEAGVKDSSPYKLLKRDDLCSFELSMLDVWKAARTTGPYILADSNCHHAVQASYNACAKDVLRVSETPNKWLAKVASVLPVVGYHSGASACGGFASESGSASHHGAFPIQGDAAEKAYNESPWAQDAAELSNWIYEPLLDDASAIMQPAPLSQNLSVVDGDILVASRSNPVQCAVVSNIATRTLYVVFRGTATDLDAIINLGVVTLIDSATCGLRVHGGMWCALHQYPGQLNRILDRVRLRGKPDYDNLVICGHSLGGAYAILTAWEILNANWTVDAVITFGAPQVLVPDRTNELWRKLDSITTLFINAYDCIPRLPSCTDWLFKVIPESKYLGYQMGPLYVGVDGFLNIFLSRLEKNVGREGLSAYGCTGTLMFIRTGSRVARKFASSNEKHRHVLMRIPEPIGPFVFQHHSMEEYVKIVRALETKGDGYST